MKQTFNLAEILTATTGRLLCDMDGVYKLSNFLTQDDLFTHQLPRAGRVIEPYLKELLPQFDCPAFNDSLRFFIAEMEASSDRPAVIARWLDRQRELYGDSFELEPMPSGKWLSIDPVTEMKEDLVLLGKDAEVIVI